MTILAIETSGRTCGVAIHANGSEIALVERTEPNIHDRMLATFTVDALRMAGCTILDIDAVAISAGPGSFTGLRIGMSFAKGLCITGTPRLVVVPTLAAMAYHAVQTGLPVHVSEVVATIGSHRDLVYVQRFGIAAEELTQPSLIPEAEALAMISDSTWHVHEARTRLSASHIAAKGYRYAQQGIYADVLHAEPMYQQDFIVQQRR